MIKGSGIVMAFIFFFTSFFTGLLLPAEGRAEGGPVRVTMSTSMGNIVLELTSEESPITVANFLQYVDESFYDGTIFHRVIRDFVIQGGGFDENMIQKTTRAPIQNEADNGLSNVAYTIVMARTPDPNSATSQFFINLKDNTFLDKSVQSDGYAVFGNVVEGKTIVDAIGAVATTSIGVYDDIPVEPVIINSISRTTDDGPDDGDNNENSSSSDDFCFLGTL